MQRVPELQRCVARQQEAQALLPPPPRGAGAELRLPVVLRYPLPYPQDPSPPPLVPRRPAELQFGNPYSTDGHAHAPDEQTSRPPPEAPLCAGPPAQASAPATPAATLEEEERQGQEGGAEEGTTGAVGGAGWVAAEVVCIQPSSRSMSTPDGVEPPAEEPRN
ncbi:hypothetical protein CRUP_016096, partial [Coryphaenoides rupestris]